MKRQSALIMVCQIIIISYHYTYIYKGGISGGGNYDILIFLNENLFIYDTLNI